MDTKKYAMGDRLTIDIVKKCPEGKNVGVITADAEEYKTQSYGVKLKVIVDLNGVRLNWIMNQTSVANMQKLGSDSMSWLGKKVAFVILQSKDKKDLLVGEPVLE